ncbi:hypothetical protein WA158_000726 [Blastocystis sp. Blastoise]
MSCKNHIKERQLLRDTWISELSNYTNIHYAFYVIDDPLYCHHNNPEDNLSTTQEVLDYQFKEDETFYTGSLSKTFISNMKTILSNNPENKWIFLSFDNEFIKVPVFAEHIKILNKQVAIYYSESRVAHSVEKLRPMMFFRNYAYFLNIHYFKKIFKNEKSMPLVTDILDFYLEKEYIVKEDRDLDYHCYGPSWFITTYGYELKDNYEQYQLYKENNEYYCTDVPLYDPEFNVTAVIENVIKMERLSHSFEKLDITQNYISLIYIGIISVTFGIFYILRKLKCLKPNKTNKKNSNSQVLPVQNNDSSIASIYSPLRPKERTN